MFRNYISRQFLATNGTRLLASAALLASFSSSVSAQNREPDSGLSKWSFGLGVSTTDKVYRDFDRKVTPLPLVTYENKWVSVGLPVSDIKLWSGESLSFRVRARFSGEGYEAKDSPFLEGMEERKFSAWVGGAVIWKTDFANVSGELLADAMGNSKGTRAKVQIDRRFNAGGFGITPRLAAEWVDDKYVDYYYGVRESEARTGRARYDGKSTTNMQIGVRVDYSMARHHTMFLDLGTTRVGGSIKNSPIVDKSNQTSLALGYVYRF